MLRIEIIVVVVRRLSVKLLNAHYFVTSFILMIRFHVSPWSPVLYVHSKDSIGCSSEILKITPKGVRRGYHDPVLWAWPPAEECLRLNTLRGTKPASLNPTKV